MNAINILAMPARVLRKIRAPRAANDNRQRSELPDLFPKLFPNGLPDLTPAELDALSERLKRHGGSIEGQSGGKHAAQLGMIITHDFGADPEHPAIWSRILEWNETCQPPWTDFDDLRLKLRNGDRYGRNPRGYMRLTLDPVGLARKVVDAWWNGDREERSMLEMIEQVKQLTRFCGSLTNRALIEKHTCELTGLKPRALDLPKDVDHVARDAREQRESEFKAGDSSIIDSRDPCDTASRILRSTVAEGVQGIIRTDDSVWLIRRDDENCWAAVADEEIQRAVIRSLKTGKIERSTGQPFKLERGHMESTVVMMKEAAHLSLGELPAFIPPARENDPDPSKVIAFKNGLLDVPTRTFMPPTRRFVSEYALPYGYASDAPTPLLWLNFLAQVFPDDPESVALVQEMMGLCMTDDTSFQKLFLLVGDKRGGKGTIARVLAKLVGTVNTCSPSLGALGQTFGLESFLGKLVAIVSDARLSAKTDMNALAENVLRVTGEDAIDVNRKHKTARTLRLRARFVIISNEPPGFVDASGALASRVLVVHFRQSFLGREDIHLEGKLLAELPGIANWALDGLDSLRKRGHFVQPASGRESLHELERLSSPVKAFVEERCELVPGARVQCGLLFQAWQQWCHEQGREHPGNAASFSTKLKAAFPGVRSVQARVSGDRVWFFEGVRVTPLRIELGGTA